MALLKTSFTTALSGIDVYMGEPVTSDVPNDFLMVGSEGDPDSEAIAEFEHSWADLGHTRVREDGAVPCAIVSQTGDVDVDSAITSGFTTLQTCINVLDNDPTLSGNVQQIFLTVASERIIQNKQGTAIVIPFTVNYWAQG